MDRPEKPPLVSVIVPARNEEQNIADCLHSLLEQGSGIEIAVEIAMEIAREIIVADDGSEDKTATIVTQTAAAQPRGKHAKLVSVPPLPPGWVGP
ncbi:MAG: glycosyltransferase, partial [Acidobacteria bacterium]|nr:glycosyltransferase [Acidobacteriota bacterium]